MKLFGLTIVCVLVLLAWQDAHALTIPSGHVLTSDGQVVEGASDDQKEILIRIGMENPKRATGLRGNSIFVVQQNTITFIPLNELMHLGKEAQIDLIIDRVIDTMLAEQAQKHIPTDADADDETLKELQRQLTEARAQIEAAANDVAKQAAEQVEISIREQIRNWIQDNGGINAGVQDALREQLESQLSRSELEEIARNSLIAHGVLPTEERIRQMVENGETRSQWGVRISMDTAIDRFGNGN